MLPAHATTPDPPRHSFEGSDVQDQARASESGGARSDEPPRCVLVRSRYLHHGYGTVYPVHSAPGKLRDPVVCVDGTQREGNRCRFCACVWASSVQTPLKLLQGQHLVYGLPVRFSHSEERKTPEEKINPRTDSRKFLI